MASTAEVLECPFCAFKHQDSYVLMLHVEERHTADSPFVVRDGPDAASELSQPGSSSGPVLPEAPADDGERWMLCPNPDCCEQIPAEDLTEHLDLHFAERLFESQQDASAPADHSTALPHPPSSRKPPKKLSKMRHGTPPLSIASEHSFSTAQDDSSDSSALAPDGDRWRSKHPRHHHHENGYEDAHVKTRARSNSEKTTLSRRMIDVLSPSSSKKLHKGKAPGARSARLGKSELGPYAYEEQMPHALYKQIEAGPKVSVMTRIGRDGRLIKHEVVDNETPGVLPVLAQLCGIDKSVDQAYICHPSTLHIFKRPREGGFCGYRNIQMLVSYIQGAQAQGHSQFPPRTPGILVLQDLIEQAWDMGINEVSRIQTGGIRGTRKYIGTPEVQALLRSLRIDHGLQIFSDRPEKGQAHEQLLDYVESYFREGTTGEQREKRLKVIKTHLPPIYLQQPGHSITIVGYERHKGGQRNILAFDPMFHTSPGMSKILGRRDIRTPRPEVLQAYRRGDRQLKRHRDYELISLKAHPPLFPAWDVIERYGDHPYVYAFFLVPALGYEVIPEDEFPIVFPWWYFCSLFCVDDARFARRPPTITYYDELDRFDVDSIDHESDTGLLGGMPPLQDRSYLDWISLFDPIRKASSGGFNKDARERLNAALQTSQLESDDFQPLPEDVYFEKSVEPAVAVHYPCGAPIQRGYRHYTFKRCGRSWSNSFSGSSVQSAITPTSSMSPGFQQPPRRPFQMPWGQQPARSAVCCSSDSSHRGSSSAGGHSLRHPQNWRTTDDVPPTSLSDAIAFSNPYHANYTTALCKRRDSAVDHAEYFTNSFSTPSAPQNAPAFASGHEIRLPIQSSRHPPHSKNSSSSDSCFNAHLHQHWSINDETTRPRRLSQRSAAFPASPPVLQLGSVDLVSSHPGRRPTTAKFGDAPPSRSPSPSSSSSSSFPFNFGGGSAGNNNADNAVGAIGSRRPPTPVDELRDFFIERSAEGVGMPVFYGTGRNDVSAGWRKKMGAEW
ncbi:uncharacterized protein BKCO1_300083 [Diplodia corticola]|uniref:UFSP1/2/DUB catalytic domain-containing protein n=1 Tax=Diplodia corticola TaxID=236234 RepID=A0A1J9SGU9_9PEZI|nr:uncharacterized protein BKCO1_300083 [Diplodia corticola]OJD39020.1 hypothetical protein BKCO1_300083 [Diplodia corticola]